jgi:peptide deformylase
MRYSAQRMAIRKIAQIGHPVLRQVARHLTPEELAAPATQQFIDDLVETMHDADGAGLAATQVYEPIAICAIEVRNNPRYPYKPNIPLTILINPVLTPVDDEQFDNYEGCLSVPNLRGLVKRNLHVRIQAWDRHGNAIDEVVHGLKAGTYQHEVDHLLGKIFVDRVTDPSTFTTWAEFDRHHKAAFVERITQLVARVGS